MDSRRGRPTNQPTDGPTGLWQRESDCVRLRFARQPVWAVWHYAQRGRGAEEEEEAGAWARLLARMLTWSFDYVFRTDYGGREGGREGGIDQPMICWPLKYTHTWPGTPGSPNDGGRLKVGLPAGRHFTCALCISHQRRRERASIVYVAMGPRSVEKNCVEKFCAKPFVHSLPQIKGCAVGR